MKRRKMMVILVAVLLVLLAACGTREPAPTEPPTLGTTAPPREGPVVLTGTVNVEIMGFDWGPAVTKVFLTLDRTVAGVSVTDDSFAVTETKEAYNMANPQKHGLTKSQRRVIGAYACDAQGNPAEESNRIALVLAYGPEEGSPYCYDMLTGKNTLCDPYELEITLTEYAMLETATGELVTGMALDGMVDLKNADYPQLEGVDLSGVYTGTDGKTLTYGSYAPEEDGSKHPLVIWLHGSGEGGTDAALPVLGNEVTAMYDVGFQETLGGAYVLTPQTPGHWLSHKEDASFRDNPGVSSIYHETLMELIEAYVAAHPAIDRNRIYVGGCSNGGFMTMDLIMNHPDYFAAAFPICEAYPDAGITDAQLLRIKELPLWFVYAENDNVVDPQAYSTPTVARLRAIGADVHTSVFEDVHDTSDKYHFADGSPLQYSGHWSWIYFFNNECWENGVSLWQWLSEQSRE